MATETAFDIVVIGGGPSGLIAALAGVTGSPLNPTGVFSGLVLDRNEIGLFARHAKLRITHNWAFAGDDVIRYLVQEGTTAGLVYREREGANQVSRTDDGFLVTTDAGAYRCRKLCVACGFYPHGYLMRFGARVRTLFAPIETENRFFPDQAELGVVVLGGGESTYGLAASLSRLRPGWKILAVLEDGFGNGQDREGPGFRIHRGGIVAERDTADGLHLRLTDMAGRPVYQADADLLLVDYHYYTTKTTVTDFLSDTALTRSSGYIPADREGRTNVPGLFAAGNIATPVSGVVTALSSGFTAGLAMHIELFRERFGQDPLIYPWLPMGNPIMHPLMERIPSQ